MSTMKRIQIDWIFYILMAAVLMGLLTWSTIGQIAHHPSREAAFGPFGLITVQLKTDPYPVKPTGLEVDHAR